MLKETVLKYYLEQDYNCAESILRAANDCYGLNLNEEALLAIGGFGGGCCCGRLCGACAGGVAAISSKYIHTRAHAEKQACDRVKAFVSAFVETLGSDLCDELKKNYLDETRESGRCVKTVELAAQVLEAQMARYLAEDEALAATHFPPNML